MNFTTVKLLNKFWHWYITSGENLSESSWKNRCEGENTRTMYR